MISLISSVFELPDRVATKRDPALVAADEEHLARVVHSLAEQAEAVIERLGRRRRAAVGAGQSGLDRDLEIHRLTARLRTLRRFGVDACLGRMVMADASDAVYVGRFGLSDHAGRRLLVDWRTPAAAPFFAATAAHPAGLTSRRRYRWRNGRICDYWDEVLAPDPAGRPVALDPDSALLASVRRNRSARMQDVLATIQADQDAVIRAGSGGALVVDGGPGTGKTVVALHRAAYLLHADPRLRGHRGGLLVIGPHRPYLDYIADVLPGLGEEGVQTCLLSDLVAEGSRAGAEPDPSVSRLKASLGVVRAIEPAVGLYEEPPEHGLMVETELGDFWVSVTDWAEAFAAPDPGTPHNLARDQVREALIDNLVDEHADADDETGEWSPDRLRRVLRSHPELNARLNRAWTLIEAADLVGDLWSVPAYLRRCAPELTPDQVQLLQRADAQAWTRADLPLIDAARWRLGDPDALSDRRRRQAALTAERAAMDQVAENLIAADDDGEGLVTMLRQPRIRELLVDTDVVTATAPDLLAGPFAHIVVDEAQELTDAEWQMLLRRCPSRSFTVVGDRAQARHGFTETWTERLTRVGFDAIATATLTTNYRTPREVMAVAEPVIRAVLPDANVPRSIRSTGVPVRRGGVGELDALLGRWLSAHPEGTVCVIGGAARTYPPRVRALCAATAKGLEFDLVVLVDPQTWGTGTEGAVDRYVAMTRSTQELVILSSGSSQ